MRRIVFLFAALTLAAVPLHAQRWIPDYVESAMYRVEQAFRMGSPGSIEDLVPSRVTIRLGDSLYTDISSIQAMQVLRHFFAGIQPVQVQFAPFGTGEMIYKAGGEQDTTHVDVWFRRSMEGLVIHALNISNYPEATVFFARKKGDK